MNLLSTLLCLMLVSVFVPGAAADPDLTGRASNRVLKALDGDAVPSGLGVNVHFADGHGEELDLIKTMGFRLIRTDLTWSTVETARGRYDWRPYDALVSDARRRGLTPLLILAYSNPLYAAKWKGDHGRQDWAYEPPSAMRRAMRSSPLPPRPPSATASRRSGKSGTSPT
jgi:hypothetical protein